MVARALRMMLAVLAVMLSPVPVQVQAQSQLPQELRVPAPNQHAATGLVFPAQIANAQKVQSVDYGKALNRPELGYSWNYQIARLLSATVYAYNLNIQTIPNGPSNPPVTAQFQSALGDIRTAAQAKHYEQLKTVSGPTDCAIGSFVFRCITLSAVQNNQSIYTGLMVTGYRNHFLKVRLDWLGGSEQDQAAVDRFVQTLISSIVR